MKKIVTGIALLSSIVLPLAVMAQNLITPPLNTNLTTYSGIESFLVNIVGGWMFGLLLILAVIFILIGAFTYLTSAGDEEKVKKAKGYVVYALIAVGVAVLARAMIALVRSFLG